MNQKFVPPITVHNTAVHTIDPTNHKLAVVFYISSDSPSPTDMTPADQEKLKEELAIRLKRVLKYLADEGYVDPSIPKWDAVSGVVVGEMPN